MLKSICYCYMDFCPPNFWREGVDFEPETFDHERESQSDLIEKAYHTWGVG